MTIAAAQVPRPRLLRLWLIAQRGDLPLVRVSWSLDRHLHQAIVELRTDPDVGNLCGYTVRGAYGDVPHWIARDVAEAALEAYHAGSHALFGGWDATEAGSVAAMEASEP